MKPKARRKRLDLILAERGLAESPEKARAIILAGEVLVNGQRLEKAGIPVAEDARIEINSHAQKYVSRGGIKLEGALGSFAISPTDWICLDIGSSTGGFTDCLLQHGAARVYAVDVNVDQLDWRLQQDSRVVRIKRNARGLHAEDVPELVDLIVADVSFISVCKVIPPAAGAAKPRAHFLILIKPQFELSKEEVGSGGIVKSEALHQKAISAVRQAAKSAGLEDLRVQPSCLLGAEGNQEYFLHARKKVME
ncbi:MAG TPA: TlyA family RNA methyltransferase [Candidatus Acidoferrum sp.]|nr:TlyA family RNA methyltransferase [Candidatus Acidoferrum sp.]